MQASAFRSQLVFEDDNGLPFHLVQPFIYYSASLDRVLTVPTGFVTDLASIPRVVWNILPPVGGYDRAAVLHDYLYQTGGVTREQADGVLKEAMEVTGKVGRVTRWTIYLGVRAGGFVTWDRYRASDPKQGTK